MLFCRATLPKTGPLPDEQVVYDRENNSKLVITYESDDDGEIYKETREYRIERVRVSSAVANRKSWKKFGDSAGDPAGPNPAYTYPGEIVTIQYLQNKLVSNIMYYRRRYRLTYSGRIVIGHLTTHDFFMIVIYKQTYKNSFAYV